MDPNDDIAHVAKALSLPWQEANVKVDDRLLENAHVMTLRVALNVFIRYLDSDESVPLGAIRDNYKARAMEILNLLHIGAHKKP